MMIRENIDLTPFNTFGIHSSARWFTEIDTVDALIQTLDEWHTGKQHKISNTKIQDILILGGGSNILFTKDVSALVLKNNITGIEKMSEDADAYYVKAGAGVPWHSFVMHCLAQGYAGVENLALIPGNVGAAPMQNIGAYGVELKDVFFLLEAYDREDAVMRSFDKSACTFAYRESVFKNKYKDRFIITSVTFRLLKIPVFNTTYGAIESELSAMAVKDLTIDAVAQAVINIRSSKLPDPAKIGNAGSFFKNPEISLQHFEKLRKDFPAVVGYPQKNDNVKLAAGWLIEQCGWKGFRRGDAGCHEKQALVLVNYGLATGKEILALSEEIQASVKIKFAVSLEREVNIFK